MKLRYFVKVVVFFLLCCLLILTSCNEQKFQSYQQIYFANVVSVIDGDTIKVQFTNQVPNNCNKIESVRLIGVDTPELFTDPPQFFANEAKSFTNQLWQQQIEIEFDSISFTRDKYNRLLAHIFFNNQCWNEQLIFHGYGRYYDKFTFEEQKMTYYKNAEIFAKENKKGLWK